ncbi:MAG: zinc carboxypeptidase [Lutibacter sp.]|uniref:M14 family metallopeptidase n=1 Tax=Lutibacter sp. TaxID=1925666 RepID=UPI00178FA88C|nr:M14 family metallopeptidase [Lutibacter sp.]MBT8317077.1 zinc carboxypeptidase [Lutibacter sp.]NNJ57937.1 zinc carboxypeptidase [Lutibacter sp.]
MTRKLFFLTALFIISISSVNSQSLKSPSDFLGYELGSRFTRHHKVVEYVTYLSENSTMVELQKYGETNEYRPLYHAYVSTEENIKNLESIQTDNLKRTGLLEGESNTNIAVVWLSYNVHGNEASSTEASMLTLYTLVMEKKEWLKNTVVIIDPCINPDGRDRYVNWYNENKSTPYNTNPEATENNEPWPRGRANHYLFDLNRDWAWASQVESQHRIKVYNRWMPQVHVDFHEQGYNSPYYFAPAAEPFHEIITDWQRDFQVEIGKNHAKYFDKNGWKYFTKERFDLLYPSYGDTYPTYMGAIGMTYEQAGQKGLGIETENGQVLSLKDRIAHHFTTGLSTVEISSKNAAKLVDEFKEYFSNFNFPYKNYVLKGDKDKIEKLTKLLDLHEIKYFYSNTASAKAYDYYDNSTKTIKIFEEDLIIPTNQPKGKMVKVLFEQEAKLTSPLTYDITAWSLPYAFGLRGFATQSALSSKSIESAQTKVVSTANKNSYAYIAKWNEVSDAAFLGDLLEAGFNVRFSEKSFSVNNNNYKRGTLIIMRGENTHIDSFDNKIIEIANKLEKKIVTTSTGFVESGKDFGSSNYELISNKKVAALAGEGTASLSFGEIWHFFETQLKYPLHIINTANFNRTDFTNYDVLILPNGYRANERELKTLASFASDGGTIIAVGSSLNSFSDKEGFSLKSKKDDDDDESQNLIPYDQRTNEYIKNAITGSIFKSTIDASHPLAFGYTNEYYSLKMSSSSYELLDSGFNVGYFAENATNVSGFAGEKALEKVPNSLLFGIERKGRGQVIYMVDNPLFRSFWENGKLFFANAIFLN